MIEQEWTEGEEVEITFNGNPTKSDPDSISKGWAKKGTREVILYIERDHDERKIDFVSVNGVRFYREGDGE